MIEPLVLEGELHLIEGEPYTGGDSVEVNRRDFSEMVARWYDGPGAMVVGTTALAGQYRITVERIS